MRATPKRFSCVKPINDHVKETSDDATEEYDKEIWEPKHVHILNYLQTA
jgi:hypothetical protein